MNGPHHPRKYGESWDPAQGKSCFPWPQFSERPTLILLVFPDFQKESVG